MQRLSRILVLAGISAGIPAWGQDSLSTALVRWHAEYSRNPTAEVIQVISPGFVIATEPDLENEANNRGLTGIFDTVPLPSAQYRPSASTVEDAYTLILQYKVVPPFSYSKRQQKALKCAENVLLARRCYIEMLINWILGRSNSRKTSEAYNRHLRYSKAYAELKERYQKAAQSGAPLEILSGIYEEEIKTMRDWNCGDLRHKVEIALSTYNALVDLDPQVTWERIQTEFNEGQITFASGRTYPNTSTTPIFSNWTENEGWEPLAKYSPATEVKRVLIQRPWLDLRVLCSLDWKLLRSAPVAFISDGLGISSRTTSPGLMPLLPVEIILARPVSNRSDSQVIGMVSKVVPQLPR